MGPLFCVLVEVANVGKVVVGGIVFLFGEELGGNHSLTMTMRVWLLGGGYLCGL